MRKLAIVAVVLACTPQSGAAQDGQAAAPLVYPGDFTVCDGYPAPEEGRDGIDQPYRSTGLLGLGDPINPNRNLASSVSRFNPQGLRACARVLAQPALLAASFHLRRANLLQARGLHNLNSDNPQAALDDLLAADAEAMLASQPRLARSLGVSNRLFRAQALITLGRPAEADTLLEEARALRPFSSLVGLSAMQLTYSHDQDSRAVQRRLHDLSTYHPNLRRRLFAVAIANGDLAGAIAVHGQLDFSPPEESFAGYYVRNFADDVAQLFSEQAQADLITATALAILGRDAESDALLAQVEARIAATQAELPLLANGRRPPGEQRRVHEYRQKVVPQLQTMLRQAQDQIDQVRSVRASDPDGHAAIAALSAALTANKAQYLDAVTMHAIFDAMPAPETAANLPPYRSGRSFLGEVTPAGHIVNQIGDATRINVGGIFASAAVVEEMALLRAAHLAAERGHAHFVLLSKDLSRRSASRPSGAYTDRVTLDVGFAVSITMVSFGAEGIPPQYAAFADRRIEAAPIIAALEPIYLVPEG